MKRSPDRLSISRLALAMILLVGPFGAACGGGGGGDSSPTAAQLGVADVEFQSLSLINESRVGASLEDLGNDASAAAVARAHSEAMRDVGFFGHANPSTGQGLRQRLRSGGVAFSAAAENLVQVNHAGNPAGIAHNELMASPTHRDNILSDGFELAGVGVARQGSTYWITQIFLRK